jgi:CHAT domain-containing protein
MVGITLNTPGWELQGTDASRGRSRGAAAAPVELPSEFLTDDAVISAEFQALPKPPARGEAVSPGALDFSADVGPGESAVVAARHLSGALTFHSPRESTRGTRGGPAQLRFIVPVRTSTATRGARGVVSQAVTFMVVKFAEAAGDKLAGLVLPTLARAFEAAAWKKKGLKEGWLKVTRQSLDDGALSAGRPSSTNRALLFIHGTFSNAASAFKALARTDFFDRVAPLYGDRIFAFDHFTISRTPEENVRMLLEGLPDKPFTFDVITHSRGGLVLRTLVEREGAFGPLASRFTLGRAVLVASPNEGTPLATPQRWEETVGWIANLIEMFPDNPFTTGAGFVANGLVWMARHASGDLPGLGSMDGDGDVIKTLQSAPPPPADSYSALVANYHPSENTLGRLLDLGIDQFFGSANDLVVPSEGGWRVDRSGSTCVPGARIGCFGPGGNLPGDSVTHVGFFSLPETATFLADALADEPHGIVPLDPAKRLPDRGLLRAGAPGVAAPAVAAGMRQAAARRGRITGGRRPQPAAARLAARPFEVTVVNGDLSFEYLPIVVGHYHAARLTGTEGIVDRLAGRVMTQSLDLGVYPLEPGTSQVFMNTYVAKDRAWLPPHPEAVIVVGLGQEGSLKGGDLVRTVRKGILAWAQRVAERERVPTPLSLAATLIGSGGSGVTVGQAARLIAQGVHEANDLIRGDSAPGHTLPLVRELRLVELYLDRATEAWRALRMQADATPGRFVVQEPIVIGSGTLARPLESGYRGADYDYITAEIGRDAKGEALIAYALDTTRARTEVRAQAAQGRLLRDLIATASSAQNEDKQIGRTLFKLLVPIELEAFLAGSTDTQIEVDAGTAGIPWELLDDGDKGTADRKPWAIRSKLLRKFRTETFRERVTDADKEAGILVVGEPLCPPGYPPLPGALEEAKAVHDCLLSSGAIAADRLNGLFAADSRRAGPDARAVVNALFERPWRVIHMAGHGELLGRGGSGGVVLSNETFVGPAEIKAMRVVPELVFINCCHLGAVSRDTVLSADGTARAGAYDRAQFASGVAEALIKIGVRCVVAAGWAVDDGAAKMFATTFYAALLKGSCFIDAVAAARAKAFEFEGNTWAAYQCYGDPDWRFVADDSTPRRSASQVAEEFDGVGSVLGLKLALETIRVQSVHQGFAPERQRERLRVLEQRWEAMKWSDSDRVAEWFADAYFEAEDFESAYRWYDAAVQAADGDVSFRAVEQRGNLLVREAWRAVERARRALEPPASATGRARTAAPGRAGRQRARARHTLRNALASARKVISAETARLARLSSVTENTNGKPRTTAERECLLGSAMKRLAMVEAAAQRPARERAAIAAMRKHYQCARDLSRAEGGGDAVNSAINLVAADLASHAGRRGSQTLDPTLIAEIGQGLRAARRRGATFWSEVDAINLRLFEAVAKGRLATVKEAIEKSYEKLAESVSGPRHWGSVYDTADFVLSGYARRTTRATERTAAKSVLDGLRPLAKVADGGNQASGNALTKAAAMAPRVPRRCRPARTGVP